MKLFLYAFINNLFGKGCTKIPTFWEKVAPKTCGTFPSVGVKGGATPLAVIAPAIQERFRHRR